MRVSSASGYFASVHATVAAPSSIFPARRTGSKGGVFHADLGPDRLAVEVRIEKECPPRALGAELAVHRDRCAGGFEDAGNDAALFQHPDQELGIAADVGLAGCHVRQCEELPQLADDGFLVGGDVGFGGGDRPRLVSGGWHCDGRERSQGSDQAGVQKQ